MHSTRRVGPAALPVVALLTMSLGACAADGQGSAEDPGNADGSPAGEGVVAFTGATAWAGGSEAPLRDATLLVRDGRIVSLESGGAVPEGAEVVDLAGRFIMPGLIDAHAHVSGLWAPEGVTGEEARLEADLLLFARYGVTTVNSLGGAPPAAVAVRRAQEEPAPGRARLLFAGAVVTGPTPDEAVAQVAGNAEMGVDWIKMRVDDNLGITDKMPWETVEAAISEADMRGIRVATHLFYLEDAHRLLELGTDLVAHSVRDLPVDDALVDRLRTDGVCYVPTLTREVTTFVYALRPEWFDDPFFQRWADDRQVARVLDPEFQERMAQSEAARRYREALVQAQENLATLVNGGAPVAFGTDSGPPGRFPGYLQHLELDLMIEAGLTPQQALEMATSGAAACLGLDDVGRLEAGRWADFLVMGADPLEDVSRTRSLEAVYVGGALIE